MRHGSAFHRELVPFGVSLSYKPAAERGVVAANEFDGPVRKGISVGYQLHSGEKWSGDSLSNNEAIVLHGAEAL